MNGPLRTFVVVNAIGVAALLAVLGVFCGVPGRGLAGFGCGLVVGIVLYSVLFRWMRGD